MNAGKYALLGAAAQVEASIEREFACSMLLGFPNKCFFQKVAGVTRMTLSLSVILLEATSSIELAVPIIFVVVIAMHVGDLLSEGIFEEQVRLLKLPMLHSSLPSAATATYVPARYLLYSDLTLEHSATCTSIVSSTL